MYTVIWQTVAENELAELWLAASDRRAITLAASTIDTTLSVRPLRLGESRASSVQRIVYQAPLGIEFEVVEDDKRVIVQGVFSIG